MLLFLVGLSRCLVRLILGLLLLLLLSLSRFRLLAVLLLLLLLLLHHLNLLSLPHLDILRYRHVMLSSLLGDALLNKLDLFGREFLSLLERERELDRDLHGGNGAVFAVNRRVRITAEKEKTAQAKESQRRGMNASPGAERWQRCGQRR